MELLSLDRVGLPTVESSAASARSPQIAPSKPLILPLVAVSHADTVAVSPGAPCAVIFQIHWMFSIKVYLPAGYLQELL
jgi:hypothetical protein